MELDWDLQAVVRGCAAATSTTTTSSASACTLNNIDSLSTFEPRGGGEDQFVFISDPFEVRESRNIDDLSDLFFFKPYVPKFESLSPQTTMPISPLSVLGGLPDLSPQQQKQKHPKQQFFGVSRSASTAHTPTSRSKRRKSQLKRVCQVPAEGLSSDMWSWRKYGQKPIKGSPYPRGYYRCSTSKGCMARKQVERNRSDPGMFIVTYTAEHNHPIPTHRNSLAGSTRQKPAMAQDGGDKPTCSSPFSPENLSPAMEKILESEEDELDVSDMAIGDDFFEGLEDLAVAGDCFSGYSPASSQFPWMVNNVTTTAAGGC